MVTWLKFVCVIFEQLLLSQLIVLILANYIYKGFKYFNYEMSHESFGHKHK